MEGKGKKEEQRGEEKEQVIQMYHLPWNAC